MIAIILEILKFTLPAAIVGATVYFMLKLHFEKEQKIKILEIKSKSSKDIVPLQMQAYERLSLLLHRIAPENMLPRLQNPTLNVNSFKQLLLQTIKSETEHNITQQIYVSEEVWNAVTLYKTDLVNIITTNANKLDEDANSFELSKEILEYYIKNENAINSQQVINLLKQDIKNLFV